MTVLDPPRREFRVNSGPGCGKTTRLRHTIQRAIEAVDSDGLPKYHPDQIVGFSFSVTAAQELRSRVRDIVPKENMSTIHARCYRALGSPPITEEPDARDAWNAYAVASGNIWAKLPPVTDRRDYTAGALDEAVAAEGTESGALLYAMYQNLRAKLTPPELWPSRVQAFHSLWSDYKRAEGLVDFNDMAERAYESFDTCPIITKSPIKRPAKVILVDEFQDCPPILSRIARLWGEAEGVDTFVCVGDRNQTIYSAFGADPRVMSEPVLPPGNEITEKHSYRLSQAVHRAALAWIAQAPDRGPTDFTPTAEPGAVYPVRNVTWRRPEPLIGLLDRLLAQATDADRERGAIVQIQTSAAYMLNPICTLMKQAGIKFHNPFRPTAGAWNPVTSTLDRVLTFLRPRPDVWGDEARLWTIKEFWTWAQWLGKDVYAGTGQKTALTKWVASQGDLSRPIEYADLLQWFTEDTVSALLEPDLTWYREHVVGAHDKSLIYPAAIEARLRKQRTALTDLRRAPEIVVGTTFSLKGTTAKDVILFPDLSPAAWREWVDSRTQQNVIFPFYVGMTRAWHDLYLCAQDSPAAVRWPRL